MQPIMSRLDRKRRRDRRGGGAGKIVLLSFGVVSALLAIAGLLGVGYIVSIADSAPDIATLKPVDEGSNTIVYSADGTKLGIIPALILRDPLPSSSIPQSMKNATVAIEDQRFYRHKGVDIEGIVRAAIKNVESHGDKVQGGSTLTMQLIKNLYPSQDHKKRGLKRKIREAKMAEQMERIHPGVLGKKWILTKYINSVFYGAVGGPNAYGVQSAARVFFNKPAHDLTIAESALLAGLPQAPSQYNPYLHRDAALRRRNEVLGKERDLGYITDAQYSAALNTPIQLHRSSYYGARRESYFFDYVKTELIRKYGRKKVLQGGLRVTTTIDFAMQRKARAAIKKNLGQPGDPSAALVSINPKDGHIRAMASSSSYSDNKFNFATQAERQPGSTFKMIVLMTALRRGVPTSTSYISKKLDFFDQPTGTKIDVNTDDGRPSNAPKTLFNAVVSSDNTVFQQLDLDVGPKNVTKTARDMGITSQLNSYPAEGLGGPHNCCTPLEMARAFTSMNDGGYRIKPVSITKVVFPDGHVDTSLGAPQRVKIFTDGQTHEAILTMKANVAGGTGTRANLGFCPTAGKTGTTSGFKDAWFNGMTTNLNTAVWVGFEQPREMVSVPGWPGEMFGGTAPATIFHDFMASAVDRKTCHDWPQPTEPFVAKPFFGRLQAKHGQGTGTYTPATVEPGITDNTDTGKKKDPNGGKDFPPTGYNTPPADGTTTGDTTGTGDTGTTTGDGGTDTTTGDGGGGAVVPVPGTPG
jgi:penicillin-binding protein 1A